MEDDLPLFGNLEEILVLDEEVYSFVTMFKTSYHNTHFHSYVVVPDISNRVIHHSDLFSHIPLYAQSVTGLTKYGQKAIDVLKHHISSQ